MPDERVLYGRRALERLNRRAAMGQVRDQPDSPILPPDIPGLALWLRSDLGVTAVMSAVGAAGTAPPAVTFTGTPSPLLPVEVDIQTPGLLGIALFRWKLGGVVQQTLQLTGANVSAGSGTLAFQFPAGTYSADNVYTATVQVSAWADQSGLTAGPSQATSALQLGYSATGWPNGKPALSNTATTHLDLAGFTLGTWSILSAFKIGTTGEIYGFGTNSAASGNAVGMGLVWAGTGNIYVDYGVSANRSDRTPNTAGWHNDNAAHQSAHTFGGTNATNLVAIDGVDVGYVNVLSGDPGVGPVTNTFYVGNDGSNFTFGAVGLIAEIIVYSRVLSATELANLRAYQKALWGTP